MGTVIIKEASTPTVYPVLLAVLPVLGVLFGAALGRWADAREKRRQHYADAVRVLVRWSEYPYRVRRRTSDDPAELRTLAERGHDLQEQLQCHRTWVQSESTWVGAIYSNALEQIRKRSAAATSDAWSSTPVKAGSGMVLDGWGPDSIEDLLVQVDGAISCRFGWRRLSTTVPWVRRWLVALPTEP